MNSLKLHVILLLNTDYFIVLLPTFSPCQAVLSSHLLEPNNLRTPVNWLAPVSEAVSRPTFTVCS